MALLLSACGGGGGGSAGGGEGHDHGQSSPTVPGAREIAVRGSSFRFDPASLTVKSGEPVTVALTSTDILHDFTIDELDAHVSAERGRVEKGGFTPKRPGTYTYYCSVAGHRQQGMEGRLVVE